MVIEIHQVEGFDPQHRSFNRNAEIHRSEQGLSARFFYEGLRVDTGTHFEVEQVMADLVTRLQKIGFTQLRSRVNFRGSRYLAERQPWIDYPGPVLR
ncbi:MAG: hypothetical protein AB1451_16665 [Nitrospirota bacterium]